MHREPMTTPVLLQHPLDHCVLKIWRTWAAYRRLQPMISHLTHLAGSTNPAKTHPHGWSCPTSTQPDTFAYTLRTVPGDANRRIGAFAFGAARTFVAYFTMTLSISTAGSDKPFGAVFGSTAGCDASGG